MYPGKRINEWHFLQNQYFQHSHSRGCIPFVCKSKKENKNWLYLAAFLVEKGLQICWTPSQDIQTHFIEVIFSNQDKCDGGPIRTHSLYQHLGIAQLFYRNTESKHEKKERKNGILKTSSCFSCWSSNQSRTRLISIVYIYIASSATTNRFPSFVFSKHVYRCIAYSAICRHCFHALQDKSFRFLSRWSTDDRCWIQWRCW